MVIGNSIVDRRAVEDVLARDPVLRRCAMTGERSPTIDAALPLPVLAGLQKVVDYLNDGRSSEAEQHARQVLGRRPDDGSTLNVIGAVPDALRRAESPART